MTSYWCEWAWLGDGAPASGVVLDVDGDRIVAVRTERISPPDDALRLAGLTVPGLVNAHSHAFHRALRSRTHAPAGSFWTWREEMYRLACRLDPGRYLELATATYAEMALAGITCVGEFHYLHDGGNELGDVLVAAAARAGIRITLLDTCYLHGGIDRPKEGVQRRFGDDSVEAWTARVDDRRLDAGGGHARLGAAIHSVRAVRPEEAMVVAAWAAERGAVLHAHVSEQPAEDEACLAAYGATPTAVLASAGAVGERFTAVHATHVTDGDIELLGTASATVALCPTTERDLADGVGPAASLRRAGATLALGSDSHAVIDLFEEARSVELDERLVTGERGRLAPATLLAAATAGGARSLDWPEAGRLAPGALADFTTIGLGSTRLAGTRPEDAVAAAVFAATGADVTTVVVGGRPVVEAGRHQLVDDVPGALRRSIEALA